MWPARVWDEKGDLNADEWTGVLRFIAVHESIARINVAKPSSAAAWVVVESSGSGKVGLFDESLMESASRREPTDGRRRRVAMTETVSRSTDARAPGFHQLGQVLAVFSCFTSQEKASHGLITMLTLSL